MVSVSVEVGLIFIVSARKASVLHSALEACDHVESLKLVVHKASNIVKHLHKTELRGFARTVVLYRVVKQDRRLCAVKGLKKVNVTNTEFQRNAKFVVFN